MKLYDGFALFYAKIWSKSHAEKILPALRKLIISKLSQSKKQIRILDIAAGSGDIAFG